MIWQDSLGLTGLMKSEHVGGNSSGMEASPVSWESPLFRWGAGHSDTSYSWSLNLILITSCCWVSTLKIQSFPCE